MRSYCVGTRRKAVLDERDISKCRLILGSDHATNFETRMVAEVHLYWIMYRSCSLPIDLPNTQNVLQKWKEEWGYLLGMWYILTLVELLMISQISPGHNSYRWASISLDYSYMTSH